MRIKDAEERKRKKEKMQNYAKIVKEMHAPQISEKKAKELEKIKNMLDQRNKRRSAPPNKRGGTERENEEDSEGEAKHAIKKPVWNFHNPLVPKPKEKKEFVKIDYLQAERSKRQNDDHKRKQQTGLNWDMMKDQNIDDKTKIELLKAKTKMIEENAERKEKMSKFNGGSVEDNVDINDMLIDAIEMKLSILDNIE